MAWPKKEKKPENESFNRVVSVALTQGDVEAIDAARGHLSRSTYVRQIIQLALALHKGKEGES